MLRIYSQERELKEGYKQDVKDREKVIEDLQRRIKDEQDYFPTQEEMVNSHH